MPIGQLKDVTARTLNWLAIIVLLTGTMIASPAGSFFAALVALMTAAVPLFFSRSKKRMIAGMVVVVAALFAYATFGPFQQDQHRYRERVRASSSPVLKP
jgi:cell division protein FtsW (lipid II flippase)